MSDVDAASAVIALVGKVYAEPGRLVEAFHHRPERRFVIEPHTHDRVLQFDLIDHCSGRARVDGRWHELHGLTALTSRPGVPHGYELEPIRGGGRVYHVKLKVDGDEAAVGETSEHASGGEGAFVDFTTDLDASRALLPAMHALTAEPLTPRTDRPTRLAWLAQVLALWPRHRRGRGTAPIDDSPDALAAADPRLAGAIELLHERTDDPPTLDELAAASHLSPRHFARRFGELIGCSPHDYLTARRFAVAKRLLLDDALRVLDVAEALGFSSAATFSRWFTQHAGKSPQVFRESPERM